jgi:hypothetical protein
MTTDPAVAIRDDDGAFDDSLDGHLFLRPALRTLVIDAQ